MSNNAEIRNMTKIVLVTIGRLAEVIITTKI